MSGFGAQHGNVDPGAGWRALSGDPLPEVPNLSAPQPQPQQQPGESMDPVHGGWQQPWQDEHGQWHYPYVGMQAPMAPPYPGAEHHVAQPQPDAQHYAMPMAPQPEIQQPYAPQPDPQPAPMPQHAPEMVIPVEQLAPVGPPRYLAPTRVARDPRQRTMAAVITFVALLIALWGILGFLGSLSTTLSSIASGNQKLKLQEQTANKGLHSIDMKTRSLIAMDEDTLKMQQLLTGIDKDMGTMVAGVTDIAKGMDSTSVSLNTLDSELGKVGEINASMADKLGGINAGLKSQVAQVTAMRKDVVATSGVLKTLPGRLTATNKRLEFVNGAVNTMGCTGITNNLKVKISLGPIPNGSATVYATVVPPGAWGHKAEWEDAMLTPHPNQVMQRQPVMGGGAAVATAPAGRLPKTYTFEELAQRSDALALAVGSRATASVLLLACVVVILIGAQSLLSTMQGMDHDLKEMNEQLAIANVGVDILNKTMDSLPPTSAHLKEIVSTVGGMSKEVKTSADNIETVAGTTKALNVQLTDIAASTTSMRESLEGASNGTNELSTTIGSLNANIEPLVKTQHEMLLGTIKMRSELDGMNASLAYTIRIMNYIAAPPTGQGMMIRADLPKETLPPLPGIKAEVEPVPVFPRNIWPIYTGP